MEETSREGEFCERIRHFTKLNTITENFKKYGSREKTNHVRISKLEGRNLQIWIFLYIKRQQLRKFLKR